MIPASMISEPRWLVWKFSTEQKKLPHDWRNPTSRAIDATNQDYWTTHMNAKAVVDRGDADGVGFAMGDGWCYVDLDSCIDDSGVINDFARGVVAELDSYTERSPSERGLKTIMRAWLAKNHARAGLEIKAFGGYTTVTGDHVEGTPTTVEDRNSKLEAVIAREFSSDDRAEKIGFRKSINETVKQFADGGRNIGLTRLAGKLRRQGLDDVEMLAALLKANQRRCQPPLDHHEVETIAKSIGRK